MSLSFYLQDLQTIIHDQNYMFSSRAQQIRWINESRRQIAQKTGCIRRLITGQSAFGASAQPGSIIPGAMQPGALPDNFPDNLSAAAENPFQMIPGAERYPYVGFGNEALKAQYAGTSEIIDVISCSVNWGGAVRPSLDWMPWDNLQAYARAYSTLLESYPYYWSCYNDGTQGEVWLFPVPSIQGEMEWDVYATPAALQTDDDFDVIPDGFRNAVKFGAAALYYLGSNRYAQSEAMDAMFMQRIGTGSFARDTGKTSSYYFTSI